MKKFFFNIEGYYKYFLQLFNINVNKLYDNMVENNDKLDELKVDFLIEFGKLYGVDVFLKYIFECFFVWGIYFYMKFSCWDGFICYLLVFDCWYNVNMVVIYFVGKKKDFEFNVCWNLGFGLLFMLIIGFY